MSGIYGTIKPANITPSDVDIFYSYRKTRESAISGNGFERLASEHLISSTLADANTSDSKLPGAYNLRLPLDVFNQKGFYTIYIRPKEIPATITAIGSLATYPDIKGIILDANDANLIGLTDGNALAGYRVEYFNGNERIDMTRLITSSHRCATVSEATLGAAVGRYRYTTAGGLLFCTVTPSLASSFKPDFAPVIGAKGQEIVLSNTRFDPVMLEVEIVDHDADTISTMLEGEQVRDLDHGLITYFDENRAIYRQYEYKALKDSVGNPAYDIKTRKINPDSTQDINAILGV